MVVLVTAPITVLTSARESSGCTATSATLGQAVRISSHSSASLRSSPFSSNFARSIAGVCKICNPCSLTTSFNISLMPYPSDQMEFFQLQLVACAALIVIVHGCILQKAADPVLRVIPRGIFIDLSCTQRRKEI